jgi:predicted enzyme related to lactoylglutathione lyase
VTPPFLLELPADEPERARRFWQELLGTTLVERERDQGRGWQGEHSGIVLGLHARGRGPGDRFALPYFAVPDLPAALDRVRALGGDRFALPYFAVPDLPAALDRVRALGGEIVHPGTRWAICRDSEGTPFGLAGPST